MSRIVHQYLNMSFKEENGEVYSILLPILYVLTFMQVPFLFGTIFLVF